MAALDQREWTLMFYFASDNGLAPEVVSQLKAIKQAGFHDGVNVIAQFDPNAASAETHIFDVNRVNKVKATDSKPRIGFVGFRPDDPYVVNLMIDKVWKRDGREGRIRDEIINSLKPLPRGDEYGRAEPPATQPARAEAETARLDLVEPGDVAGPEDSLYSFLHFCAANYPAKHYMLFILGHGLVVGNDTFLEDDNAPVHFLHLKDLGEVLDKFKREVAEQKAEFELISFHSCSMSSLEVAYELQGEYAAPGKQRGTANYMLAAQGPSFVGSWPYRQILIRIFNYLERRETNVRELLKNIFSYCLYNSYDFIVAGYNFDVCLCDLNEVASTRKALSQLSSRLIDGVQNPLVQERMLLAHLDAQSFWLENYIDLRDFCLCLKRRLASVDRASLAQDASKLIGDIEAACDDMSIALRKEDETNGVEGSDGSSATFVIRSEFAGTMSQFARGLSVYFPWARPVKVRFWPQEYNNSYRFFTDFKQEDKQTPWSEFLAEYFDNTRRTPRVDGDAEVEAQAAAAKGLVPRAPRPPRFEERLLERFATQVFDAAGQLSKGSPTDSQGDNCECPSIKNYPMFTRMPSGDDGMLEGTGGPDATSGTIVSPSFLGGPNDLKQLNSDETFVLDNLLADAAGDLPG